MDKWKDIELEKMKIGSNRNARVFFEAQPDWDDHMTIQQKYNSKAAALYRDKISVLAQGKSWDEKKSPAQNYTGSLISSSHSNNSHSSSSSSYANTAANSYQNTDSYQSGYQNYNSSEFKDQKDAFFARVQSENAGRRG